MAYKFNRHHQAKKWLHKSIEINEAYEPSKDKYIPRGRVVNVNYGENIGFEKNLERPSVILSTNSSNQSSGNVLVAPLTDKENKRKKDGKIHLLDSHYILLKEHYPGLKYDSIVQCEDLRVVSKARLGDLLETVNKEDLKAINKRLKYILEL